MKLPLIIYELILRLAGVAPRDRAEAVRVFRDLLRHRPRFTWPLLLGREMFDSLPLILRRRRNRPPMLEYIYRDARFAFRSLARTPAFSSVAVAALALGIGANTAIFSVISGVLLRSLPYADPDRLAMVRAGYSNSVGGWLSQPEVLEHRELDVFAGLGAYYDTDVNVTGDAQPEFVPASLVEAEVFETLGARPLLGRYFRADEAVSGVPGTVVLGYSLWTSRFGRDPRVIGASLLVNGRPATIVGIMGPDFRLPTHHAGINGARLWLPLVIDPANLGSRGSHYLHAVARLAPGVSLEQANAAMGALIHRLTDEGHYHAADPFATSVVALDDHVVGSVRPALLLLAGAVAFVLLTACANVANLMLARAEGRSHEVAVRTALGASRGRLLAQVLAESMLLSLAGGLAGIGVAAAALEVLRSMATSQLPRFEGVTIDARVLVFAAGLSVLTGLVFGLSPFLATRWRDLQSVLREAGRGAAGRRGGESFRRALVTAQVAFAVLLATGASLLIRSFAGMLDTDLGFDSRNVVTAELYLPTADYPDNESASAYARALLERVRGVPGVESAGLARAIPLTGAMGDWSIEIEGLHPPSGTDFDADWQVVTPGYAEAMGLRLVEGRLLQDADDRADAMPVVLVNQALAREYWPGESPVGRRLRLCCGRDYPWATVVGVLDNVRHNGVAGEITRRFYLPSAQYGVQVGPQRSMYLVVRSGAEPGATIEHLRREAALVDPGIPLANVRPYADIVAESVVAETLITSLLTAFGALALVLAALGVYGVVAYSVARRSPEIGVRIALGASGGQVARMVLVEGVRLALVGSLAGVGAAALLTRFLRGFLYGVAPLDPVTFALVPILMGMVTILASGLPAVRAARVPPALALRAD